MTSLSIKNNKKISCFTNGYNNFILKRDIKLIVVYICLYLLFAVGIIPKDIIFGLITGFFIVASTKGTLIMYLFFVLWENVGVFSFGLTLSFLLQIILFIKIIINCIRYNKIVFYNLSDMFFLMLSFFYGFMNFLIGTGGLTGIRLAINVIIALYSFTLYQDEEQSAGFWKAVFFTLMLSTIIASIYGFFNDTANDRWIAGMGYIKQIYGTVGTARMGMYFCASLIYPVFYLREKMAKIILCLMLSLGALMTFSITTLICLVMFWGFIILFKNKTNIAKKIIGIFIVFLCLFMLIIFWDRISEIIIFKPISIRIEKMVEALQSGNINAATSSRSYLAEMYINDFKEYSIINKLFGSFFINRFSVITGYGWGVENYAHNSIIDILLYMGIFGVAIFFIKLAMRASYLRKREEFLPVILLKLIFMLTGLSVSMLTNSYWFIFMVL